MTPLSQAFRGQRVLVTGHTGFKGSWLALWLHRLGARVTGYSLRPPTEPSHFAAARVADVLEQHVEADVRDADRLAAALRASDPGFVFHLAAQAIVGAAYESPCETFDVNVMGTVNVLEAVRSRARPCVVVVVTSDKCYETPESEGHRSPLGFREDDPLGGADPYSASKGAAEIAVRSYLRSYFRPAEHAGHGVRLASARAGNVIGGGDWSARRIVPDLARAAAAGQPPVIRMPDAVRPWQHVLEPLSGYLALAARLSAEAAPDGGNPHAGGWNFGPPPESCVPVRDLVEAFQARWGGGAWQDASATAPAAGEVRALNLCSDKARGLLGWRPRWNLATALERTVAWYRRYYAAPSADLAAASMDDIAAYEASERLA
jgi:CDP-glucose 4,6-dehydratase